ncbi:MAG: DUF3471 domain-containing protein [Candidatus Tenebribacter davisii]|nr:DUF3471 domain-containing protein [Candidatus Tenebribacter davisii]
MLRKVGFILLGILLSQGILISQTIEFADSLAYKLGFSTYLSHTDRFASGFDIYTDSEGFTYISGNTRDKNFPATEGAYQTELKGLGLADAFVAKFTPKGEIVFATLIGGTKREHHTAITVDEQGFIYLAGGTESSDFPVTEGVYDSSFNGEGEWAGDVFLTKMNPTGTDIIFSTFIGGVVEETVSGGCIKIDSKGNIILAGVTLSHDFPLTKGVIESEDKKQHGFLSKFSPDGEKLLFSTFFGSSSMEMILGLDVDDKDNIYITGGTLTADLPVTDKAVRKEFIEPNNRARIDHFIAKINDSGSKILYLSYFAAEGYMSSNLKWTKPNRLIVCGSTNEESFPVTDDAISKIGQGMQDCFISVFNSDNMTLEYSTLLGGSEAEHVMSANFLNKDTIVIGGTTSSADFPLTENALYSEYPVCEKTFNSTFFARKKSFVSVIDIKNSKLLYSTYFGSCFLFNIYPDKFGNISFVAEAGQRAEAGITGFPVSRNAIMEPPTYTMVGRLVIDEPIDDAILESYVGEYELRAGVTFTVTKEGKQLKVQVTGQDPFEIYPESENVFYLTITEAQITFNSKDDGQVESMTFLQNGRETIILKLAD